MDFIGVLFRLVGGNSSNEGRVEVYYNHQWGTVCDDGWDDIDAGVVCRQLGFGSSGTAIGSAGFGQGSGPIWLSSVTCTGSESQLTSCGHLGVGVTSSCLHDEDAGVKCSKHGKGLPVILQYSSYNILVCKLILIRKEPMHRCRNWGGWGATAPPSFCYVFRSLQLSSTDI